MRAVTTSVIITVSVVAMVRPVTAQRAFGVPEIIPLPETMGRHIGRLQGKVRLRRVVAPALRPACDALEAGKMADAERAFRSAVARNRDDYAARVGLIQATYATHEQQVRDLLARKGRPGWSRYERFTLGVLRLYQYSDAEFGVQKRSFLANQPLLTESGQLLKGVFLEARDPIVGLVMCEARYCAHGWSDFDPLLRLLLSAAGWHAFEQARAGEWHGDLPETVGISRPRLEILERVCAFAACAQGSTGTSFTPVMRDGRMVVVSKTAPAPGCSQVAYAWLRRWQTQLQRQLAAAPED